MANWQRKWVWPANHKHLGHAPKNSSKPWTWRQSENAIINSSHKKLSRFLTKGPRSDVSLGSGGHKRWQPLNLQPLWAFSLAHFQPAEYISFPTFNWLAFTLKKICLLLSSINIKPLHLFPLVLTNCLCRTTITYKESLEGACSISKLVIVRI